MYLPALRPSKKTGKNRRRIQIIIIIIISNLIYLWTDVLKLYAKRQVLTKPWLYAKSKK